ncbi:DUF4192 domain-containing protein [Nocardioides sp. KR10-350]|uniref:DUF4192 domain-containing protein n=1 Tax=Nocardioides cheoyonin TaxID=3156615 RepID=UPI0032B40BE8
MNRTLTISSHDELLSYVPHVLGFRRPQGMVCLPMGGGPISRVDLPPTPREKEPFLSMLADVYLHRHPTRRVALVAYGEDGRACLEALSDLGERLIADPKGPEVGPMLWVHGDEWFDVLQGTSGTVDPSVRARFDAEFALMGRVMPVDRREDLAAAMQGDPAGVARHLEAAEQRAMGLDAGERTAEVAWLESTLEEFIQNRSYLPDGDAARVLAFMHDSGARDAAVSKMTRENAPVLAEFWQDLVRRSPTEVRDSPATMLALSAFLSGDGAKAWTALDQLSEHDRLADLVTIALEQAVDPKEWDRIQPPRGGAAAMQQAALQNPVTHDRRGPDKQGPGAPGVGGPGSAAPGR